MTKMRLFIAVDPSPENIVQFGKTIDVLRTGAPKAKWARPEKLHVTLAFLGDVDEAKIPDIMDTIRFVASQHAPFSLRFEGGGTFGGKKRARVLWAGVGGDLPALCQVQTMLSEKLAAFGYEPEHRAFSPHLTFARAADPRGDASLTECAGLLEGQCFGDVTIGELVLYRSELSSKGATYTALLRESFKKTTAAEGIG